MEHSNYNILYIDDDCKLYTDPLKAAAKPFLFEIHPFKEVLEGLEFLKVYPDLVHAVILDLAFPKGEMQGMDALTQIKALYPDIPVIILTGSDGADDIERVVECMKRGAYNYVGKKRLNAVYLFQVVQSAVKESRLRLQLKAKTKRNSAQSERFFTIKENVQYERGSEEVCYIFGFELNGIYKIGGNESPDLLEKKLLMWHYNFFQVLGGIYDNREIEVRLKYISGKGKTIIRIIFLVFDEDEKEAQKRLSDLQQDLVGFFGSGAGNKEIPYQFREITDKDYLSGVLDTHERLHYTVFYKTPLQKETQKQKSIGFSTFVDSDELSDEYTHLFPPHGEIIIDNELFNALNHQDEYTEIDIQMFPRSLVKQEIDLLREVIQTPTVLEENNLLQKYPETPQQVQLRDKYIDFLRGFTNTPDEKFLVSVILLTESPEPGQHIISAIENYFFNGELSVVHEKRELDTLNRFRTSKNGGRNLLPFTYTLDTLIQSFRFPVISGKESYLGIPLKGRNFEFMPDSLPNEGILLGVKDTLKGGKSIFLNPESLSRHLYIMGQTGTGKSTLLKTMILHNISRREGFTLIDPHGDLTEDVLKHIPQDLKKRLYIIDVSETDSSHRMDLLEYDQNRPESKSMVVNEIMRSFMRFYTKESVGPMFEQYFKNGLLLIMDDNVQVYHGKPKLSEMDRIFRDTPHLKELLKVCSNEKVKLFFDNALKTVGEQSFENFASYITSKLNRFVEDYYISQIIEGEGVDIPFRKLLDQNGILLVRLDKGLIGTDNTELLGQLILSKIILAGMSRSNLDKDARKPHTVYIDEFQNFVKGDVASALSEVRKYNLRLVLANQTLGQLDEFTVNSLLGNVGSLLFFRPGLLDYRRVQDFLEPEFKREEILKLPNFNCIARLLIDNIPTDPFVFQTVRGQ